MDYVSSGLHENGGGRLPGEGRRVEERELRREEAKRRGEERIRRDEIPSSGDSYRVSLGTHTCPLLTMSGEVAEAAEVTEVAQAGRTAGRALPLYPSQEIA